MREIEISTKVKVCSYDELPMPYRELVDVARKATERSYAPYSGFSVGAAVRLANGEVVAGNNQENAAYPSGLCAERTTLFWANARYPDAAVEALAIAARNADGELPVPIPPCGACRQVMLEVENRFDRAMRIILYGARECYVIEEGVKALLPLCFNAHFLE